MEGIHSISLGERAPNKSVRAGPRGFEDRVEWSQGCALSGTTRKSVGEVVKKRGGGQRLAGHLFCRAGEKLNGSGERKEATKDGTSGGVAHTHH